MATISITPKSTISPGNDVVEAEVFIAAPRERVFHAIIDPKQAVQWWGSCDRYKHQEFQMDVRVGGKWSSKGTSPTIGDFTVQGEYIEIDPPRRLVYSWQPTWMQKATKVAWELDELEGGTLVRITHTGFAGDAEQAGKHSTGWAVALGWLQGYVEKGDTVETRK